MSMWVSKYRDNKVTYTIFAINGPLTLFLLCQRVVDHDIVESIKTSFYNSLGLEC